MCFLDRRGIARCICAVVVLVLVGSERLKNCPKGFFRISDSCYFVYNGTNELFTWMEAREQCKNIHPQAELLAINNQVTQDALDVVISRVSWPIWIGLQSYSVLPVNASSYRWIPSNKDIDYSNWASDAFTRPAVDSGLQCAFLSTSSLSIGVWRHCNCNEIRMGFGCEVPFNASFSSLTPRFGSAQPVWLEDENESGHRCFLGTCYRQLFNISLISGIDDAKKACGNEAVAVPRNPLELAFLRILLAFASNSTRAWLGLEVTITEDKVDSNKNASKTPWLTAVIHRSRPTLPFVTVNQSATFCFQIDLNLTTSSSHFLAVPCMGGKDDEGAPLTTVFCTAQESTFNRTCPHSANVEWHAFGDKCFAIAKECIDDSVPASLTTPEVDNFAAWLLFANVHPDVEVLIGGIVNSTSPLAITWFDGSISKGFNRLKPSDLHHQMPKDGLCLAIEVGSGWWVPRKCEEEGASRPTLCSMPIKRANISAITFPISNVKYLCPKDYFPLHRKNGSVVCFRLFLDGPRSHGLNWRAAERACRRFTRIEDSRNLWRGHLACLSSMETSHDFISLLQKNNSTMSLSDSANGLPAHILKPSEFVWLGLSKSEHNLSWNNWTDGSTGNPTFYEARVHHQHAFFADSFDYFFYRGSCIALHLPSDTWYSLRCTLDLGYICQASLTPDGKEESGIDHFDTPSCLISHNSLNTITGFNHDPSMDCVAPGFTYFNGHCFRTFHDKFMTFAEAQAYCRESGLNYSRNGNAGLAVLRSEADQLFVASQLSHLPRLPDSQGFCKRGSTFCDPLEVAWRRYHWVGLFHYRHAFHSVNESVPCYIANELNRALPSSAERPQCVSITGVPNVEHFGTLSFDIDCNKRLPFVCSFEPLKVRPIGQMPNPVCPEGYATHHAATGDHCYLFIRGWQGTYEEAEAMCAHTAPAARLAALTTPFTIAWMRAHLPSDLITTGTIPWESAPHWIGLKIPAHDKSSWQWTSGAPVTHTSWSSPPVNIINPNTDTCFAFAKAISMPNYELDMVAVNCSRSLSPLCEADPLVKLRVFVPKPRENYSAADQHDYIGRLAESTSGKACIRWDLVNSTNTSEMEALRKAFHSSTLTAVSAVLQADESPDTELHLLAFQPTLSSASNWCRNPASLRDHAFCYIDDDKWEFCNLPLPSTSPPFLPPLPTFRSETATLISSVIFSIVGVFISIILFMFLCVLLSLYLHRKSRSAQTSNSSMLQMLLLRVPFAWRWRWVRTASQPCLLGDSVCYSIGTLQVDAPGDSVR